MPILADYHMHSSFSGDSRAPMQDMAARAIALGYQEICFTEHMDLHYPASEECPEDMFLLNTDSYLYDLLRAREKFGEQINIKFGAAGTVYRSRPLGVRTESAGSGSDWRGFSR